jgi:hypothetical protein
MRVSFTFDGQSVSRVPEEGWRCLNPSVRDLLTTLEASYPRIYVGYDPSPLESFVSWLAEGHRVQNIVWEDLPELPDDPDIVF